MTIHVSLDLETWGTRPGCDIRSIGACVFDPVSGQVSVPCQYCQNGQYTGMPGNACENCMNTGMTDGYGSTFYVACDNPWMLDWTPQSQRYPLHRDPRTVQWWSEQSDEAQAAFADPVDLREALIRLREWLSYVSNPCKCVDCGGDEPTHHSDCTYMNDEHGEGRFRPLTNLRIWSHGAAFDPPILAAAYEAVGLPVPWHYRAPRDTRTLFDLAGVTDHSAWLAQHPGPLGLTHHALDDAICQARAVCAAWLGRSVERTKLSTWRRQPR